MNLHLIAFDIPFPPDYGGVIDIYYKIKALHEHGIKIYLHCFQYREKQPAPALEPYCQAVYYYPRKLFLGSFFSTRPFIVQTRRPDALLKRLIADSYPILFEGIHTCAFIGHPELSDRLKLLRMHNVEWAYYRHLAKLEKNVARAFFLYSESIKLRDYKPRVLAHADIVLPISPADASYFRQRGHPDVRWLPAFHGHQEVTSKEGTGAYALFHGNLSVPDNEKAVRFLIKQVLSVLNYPLYIAGRRPSKNLWKLCLEHPNLVRLFPNPSEETMERLVENAHINLMYTHQSEGFKIKLLHSLFSGRFCVANSKMVRDTGLESLCRVADTAEGIQKEILRLRNQPFTAAELQMRRQLLSERYKDLRNAQIILRTLQDS